MKSPNQSQILLISHVKSSFVLQDQELLRDSFDIRFIYFNPGGIWRSIKSHLWLLLQLLAYLWKSRIILIWFADYHSLLPSIAGRLFLKRVYIILGGYDTCKIPAYNYGGHIQKYRSMIIKLSCRCAHKVLPVSEFTAHMAIKNIGDFLNTKTKVVYNAVDTIFFNNENHKPRSYITTVALADNMRTIRIKGLDTFCNLAKAFPEHTFCIIGVMQGTWSYFENMNIENLKLIKPLPRTELRDYYKNSKYICQFSLIESFGLAVAEAMACGCLPIAFDNGALPEIVPSQFIIRKSDNVVRRFREIEKYIASNPLYNPRKIIVNSFSTINRKKTLLEILK